ncbi:CPBP family intramembrane metalloprotease [Paenibacillus lautus]|uniref:CPBP family intramembrane glutamic endopeptidase n=1 Tax=Paenibacillus lautus TaxID=1401 RepID=UPI002DBA0A7E|nr:CPBP family intramembrane glutamic endopeptidase [Paenibacillus lautus]MEC0205672.1 CPBP family intramembrane metalloprotease [Paenibacillus lautus]
MGEKSLQVTNRPGEFITCLIIMIATIVWVQWTSILLSMAWGIGLILMIYSLCKLRSLRKISIQIRDTAIVALIMVIGYMLYHAFGEIIKNGLAGHDAWAIILSRLSLILFVLPFALAAALTKEKPLYLATGSWGKTIYFPWIFKGPVKDPIWRFMLIFLVVVCAIFSFFMDWGQPQFPVLIGYALSFALINAVLEELLWRGYILSHFVSRFGELKGLVIAGITFGLYHYHLGFSWPVCLLFSIFGIMMGGVAIRSKGLVPVMVMHFIMNVLFVLSGMIL